MTKTILTITAALTLTTPFVATPKVQQLPVEANSLIATPINHTAVAGSYSSSYNPGICTRDGLYQPIVVVESLGEDFVTPVHCKELNCGLGIYAKHVDSNEEHCSACGALKPVDL